MKLRATIFLSLLAFPLILPRVAHPLTVLQMTPVDLARQSDTVFRGYLADVRVRATPDGQWILTDYIYSVSRCYRMTTESCPDRIQVTLLGGKVGDRFLGVPGMPDLRRRHGEMIFFLSDGVPTGVSQGIFEVTDGRVSGPSIKEHFPQGIPLSDFENELPRLLSSVLHGTCDSLLCFSDTSPPPGWSSPEVTP